MSYTFKNGDRPLRGYTIRRGVGRGGFGEVYYAVSDGGREVALKYLRDNPEVELRGVSQCMNLKSPHLVTIFDVMKNDDGEYFVVMEYISGPSLRDLLLAEPKGFGVEKAAYFLKEIARGLSYLHERGVVHRDLKPANIFFDDGMVKIVDYGLSKFISVSRHSAQTASVGTVHYMAPEVGGGDYSRGIDIYALGVIFYEMLLGRVPFEGSSMGEVLMKHLTSQPEIDQLPDRLGHVIRKALAKDPKDRYQTVDEMVSDATGEREPLGGSRGGVDMDVSLSGAVARHVAKLEARGGGAAVALQTPPVPPPLPAGMRSPSMPPFAQPVAPLVAAAAPAHGLAPEVAAGQVRYAGFWIRVGACVIDSIIILVVTAGAWPLSAIVGIAYEGLMVGLWNGQTLGKKACGIKVISADGRPCGVGQAFGRSFAGIISGLILCIGYLMVAFDSRKRALHDRMANTLHIYAGSGELPQPQIPGSAVSKAVPARHVTADWSNLKVDPRAFHEVKAAFLRYSALVDGKRSLAPSSKQAYTYGARCFVRWLESDFQPRQERNAVAFGEGEAAIRAAMPTSLRVSPRALEEIASAFYRYQAQVDGKRTLASSTKQAYIHGAGCFVRWLQSDFMPGGQNRD